jgi:hypothetical protein
MQLRTIFQIAAVLVSASLPIIRAQSTGLFDSAAVIVSTDMDCVVAIDDKVVGRIEHNHKELFPAPVGTHTLSAATTAGDYWEQSVISKRPRRKPSQCPLSRSERQEQLWNEP